MNHVTFAGTTELTHQEKLFRKTEGEKYLPLACVNRGAGKEDAFQHAKRKWQGTRERYFLDFPVSTGWSMRCSEIVRASRQRACSRWPQSRVLLASRLVAAAALVCVYSTAQTPLLASVATLPSALLLFARPPDPLTVALATVSSLSVSLPFPLRPNERFSSNPSGIHYNELLTARDVKLPTVLWSRRVLVSAALSSTCLAAACLPRLDSTPPPSCFELERTHSLLARLWPRELIEDCISH